MKRPNAPLQGKKESPADLHQQGIHVDPEATQGGL